MTRGDFIIAASIETHPSIELNKTFVSLLPTHILYKTRIDLVSNKYVGKYYIH